MSSAKLWIYAARPKTLTIGLAPILIGTSLAIQAGSFNLLVFFWTLLGALMIQVGTNYSNDYFDYLKGADKESRKGTMKVLQSGLVSKKAMKTAFILCFSIAAIASIILTMRGGVILLVVGSICILFSLLYTAGPMPLAYLGLGDVFVLVFYGPVATIFTFYLQTLHFDAAAFIASFAPGLLGVAVITVNNLRDIAEDKLASKKTLPVRFGKKFAKIHYTVMIIATFFIPILYVFYTGAHYFCILASLVMLFAVPLIKHIFTYNDPKTLNATLASTAKLIVPYTLLFCLGAFI
ncbi:MAG: 1,4-dihydroxy-2-naphthoate octaprenyltransferase [Chlamydiia bacterium]|nr:1,4-dihydroxy-2-naphthoate octaprenyltransferase [Chlamydiia bacterium]